MVEPGVTDRVPEVETDPMLSLRVHESALVELQLSVDEEPLVMDAGVAVRVAVGVLGLIRAVQVALADPPELRVTVARPVFSPAVA